MASFMSAEAITSVGSITRSDAIDKTMSVASPAQPEAVSFGGVLGQVATDAVNTLKTGEAASISGIQGGASARQVVEAVMSAEQTLQTAVAIRDKVVQAYQEISRMAI